jgi:hypothetical protein
MSAFKVVQKIPSLVIGSTAGISTSNPISLKSGYIRIVPTGNAYVEIGYNPGISTSNSFWIQANTEVVLKEKIISQPVVGIITGTATTLIIPEGTSSSFIVGDYVELSGISTTGINTNFARVSSVDNSTSVGGYYATRLVIDWNTSAQSPVTNVSGEIRKAVKIAAYNDSASSNTIHITEVVSNFS